MNNKLVDRPDGIGGEGPHPSYLYCGKVPKGTFFSLGEAERYRLFDLAKRPTEAKSPSNAFFLTSLDTFTHRRCSPSGLYSVPSGHELITTLIRTHWARRPKGSNAPYRVASQAKHAHR